VFFREIMAVCCGNCGEHISADFVAIHGFAIILADVLYGRGTCSITLKEDRRLIVFEIRVLRRIFGPKRDR
jgi:hypothetical protein